MKKELFTARSTRCFALALVLFSAAAHADHGACPCIPPVSDGAQPEHRSIIEPRQRAIVLWNGRTERLILATDVAIPDVFNDAPVVEFIPLPSRPSITAETEDVFNRFEEVAGVAGFVSRRPSGAAPQDFGLTHLQSAGSLVAALSNRCSIATEDAGPVNSIGERYLQRGLAWFAIDTIRLNATVRSFPPIAYEFASTGVFYPLDTSTMADGDTVVELAIVTPDGVERFDPMATPLEIEASSVIDVQVLTLVRADWADFMNAPTAKVQRVVLRGKLKDMRIDLHGH